MATIFTLRDDNLGDKINMDDLYEKQQQENLETLKLYQKILGRIHVRIKSTSRQRDNKQFCTYLVPEVMIGVPKYDNGACIAYLIEKLKDNGFNIKYIHPNLLFISWNHWIPGYVRNEVKKQTGMTIDGYGNLTDKSSMNTNNKNIAFANKTSDDPNNLILSGKGVNKKDKKIEKEFKSISSYVPSGNVIYNPSLLKKDN